MVVSVPRPGSMTPALLAAERMRGVSSAGANVARVNKQADRTERFGRMVGSSLQVVPIDG
jgi:hypothetical protein